MAHALSIGKFNAVSPKLKHSTSTKYSHICIHLKADFVFSIIYCSKKPNNAF